MKNDTIHRFIHALDKGELRYCREALLREEGAPAEATRKLFEVLVQMKNFNREELKEVMANDLVGGQLAVQKFRLFRFLVNQVKLLRQNREAANLWSIHQEGRLFLSMGLIDEAYELVRSGVVLAVKLEELYSEVVLRELLREIFKNMDNSNYNEEITANEYLLETAGQKLSTLIKYTQINDQMFSLNRRYRFTKDPNLWNGVQELFQSEHLQNINLADSLPSQLRFFRARAGYFSSINDSKLSLENYERCLTLWDSNPSRIKLYPHMYLGTLSNVLGKLSMLGRIEESPKYLDKLEALEVTTRREEVLKFTYLETQYYLYLMNSGRFSDAAEREKEVVNGLRKFGLQVPEDFRINFRYNIAVSSLVSGDSRKALFWFNEIREMGVLQSRQDIQGIARLFRLLLIHEDDSSGNFSHFLRNSKRFFTENHPSYALETTVYSWLKKNHEHLFGPHRKRLYQDLANSIQEFCDVKVVGSEELLLLAKSKASGSSISHLFSESLAKGSVIA